jgi:hypothetical protein
MKSAFAVTSVVQCANKNSFLNESSQHKLDILVASVDWNVAQSELLSKFDI